MIKNLMESSSFSKNKFYNFHLCLLYVEVKHDWINDWRHRQVKQRRHQRIQFIMGTLTHRYFSDSHRANSWRCQLKNGLKRLDSLFQVVMPCHTTWTILVIYTTIEAMLHHIFHHLLIAFSPSNHHRQYRQKSCYCSASKQSF